MISFLSSPKIYIKTELSGTGPLYNRSQKTVYSSSGYQYFHTTRILLQALKTEVSRKVLGLNMGTVSAGEAD